MNSLSIGDDEIFGLILLICSDDKILANFGHSGFWLCRLSPMHQWGHWVKAMISMSTCDDIRLSCDADIAYFWSNETTRWSILSVNWLEFWHRKFYAKFDHLRTGAIIMSECQFHTKISPQRFMMIRVSMEHGKKHNLILSSSPSFGNSDWWVVFDFAAKL